MWDMQSRGIIPARGEQVLTQSDKALGGGSSPRARGAAAETRSARVGEGIIPARGEQCGCRVPFLALSGSSPRARGAVTDCLDMGGMSGIIPARAGSSYRQGGSLILGGIIPARAGSSAIKEIRGHGY